MKRKLILYITLLALTASILAAGCTPQKRPRGAPTSEPTIFLFVKETGEKKQINLEKYIEGVVAAEMDPTWPENALAAQAILARTFTLGSMREGKIQKLHGTDASTDPEEFQAYDPTRINNRVRQAVSRTRGEVIVHNGDYVRSFFSASCGGTTATPAEGGFTERQYPYVKAPIKDPGFEITAPENKHWELRVPLEEVRLAVREIGGSDPGEITSVDVTEWGPSGRAMRIKFNSVEVGAPALRKALGSQKMRSTFLKAEPSIEGDSLVLTGKGFGHGVGMCQWGARKMAQDGKEPEDIIKFYYKNVQIQKLWR